MASGDSVQLIKDRLNILDVIGQYVELHRAGRHFKGRCPFHHEKTPSFHVSPERGTYHCFGCGAGGDIFSFIEAIEGVDFKEALKTLAQKAGVELVPEDPQRRTEREYLISIIESATSFYEGELQKNADAIAYLERRGLTKETIKKWRIGYAPGPPTGGWRELKSHLNATGFKDDILLKAGLIKTTDGGKEPFDVFRDRVMFPMRDQGGRVVAFSGRILHPDEKSPKYVNSPETELFHKSDLLYGYDFAKHHIRQLPFWLLVEGQFDVVMSHQSGYATAVAVSGTALTTNHVQLLERLSKNVVLGLDTDKAGIAAMKKSADLMLRRGMDVKVARFTDGADPADMVLKDLSGFKKAIGHSVHIIEFLLDHLRREIEDERTYKLKVRDEVVPFVALIPNRIDQEHFEEIIAKAIGTTKDAIHFEVRREQEEVNRRSSISSDSNKRETPAISAPNVTADRIEKIRAYLLAATKVVAAGEAESIRVKLATVHNEETGISIPEVGERLIEELTFTIESEFDGLSDNMRLELLAHKINLYRELVVKDAIQSVRERLLVPKDGETEQLLAQVARLTILLRLPPVTGSNLAV